MEKPLTYGDIAGKLFLHTLQKALPPKEEEAMKHPFDKYQLKVDVHHDDAVIYLSTATGMENAMTRVMNTQDDLVRKALIDMGWTPPTNKSDRLDHAIASLRRHCNRLIERAKRGDRRWDFDDVNGLLRSCDVVFAASDREKVSGEGNWAGQFISDSLAANQRKFQMGQRVRKIKGSSWHGTVRGFYSTSITPIGYAVESEREPGSVQIYPESALKRSVSIERPRTALELIAFAAWVNVPVDKLPPEMLGHTNQATMEAWKRVVDAVQTATRNPCAGIFDHKWLDPECVHGGCQSLSLPKNWPEAAKND